MLPYYHSVTSYCHIYCQNHVHSTIKTNWSPTKPLNGFPRRCQAWKIWHGQLHHCGRQRIHQGRCAPDIATVELVAMVKPPGFTRGLTMKQKNTDGEAFIPHYCGAIVPGTLQPAELGADTDAQATGSPKQGFDDR